MSNAVGWSIRSRRPTAIWLVILLIGAVLGGWTGAIIVAAMWGSYLIGALRGFSVALMAVEEMEKHDPELRPRMKAAVARLKQSTPARSWW